MALTLLEIAQRITGELGLPEPSAVVSSTDVGIRQLYTLINREGDNLRRAHPTGWTVCQFEFNLPIGNPTITTGTLAANSAVITGIPTTAGLAAWTYMVAGNGIPQAARILSVDSATQVTMTMEATGAATATALTFAKDTFAEPSDFDHFNNNTSWDRTNHWSLLGPDSPQVDQWHRSGIVATGPRRHFRQLGPGAPSTGTYAANYRLWPPPTQTGTPFQVVFEYASKNWVYSQAGAYQASFLADTDTPLLDDQAIILGVKWRLWQIKGMDYAAMQAEYQDYVDQLIARDGGASILSLARPTEQFLISPWQVADGGWPGPTGANDT